MKYGNTILFLIACSASGYICGSDNFFLDSPVSPVKSRHLGKRAGSSKNLPTVREETPEEIAFDNLLTLCNLLGKGVSLVPMSEYTKKIKPTVRTSAQTVDHSVLHAMPVHGAPGRFAPNNSGKFLAGSSIMGICKGGK